MQLARRRRCGFVVPAVIAYVWLAAPRPAFGFLGREHRAIGAEAYIAACTRLAPRKDRDPETALRYTIACGNLEVQALLYGQGCAVSGDWSGDPGDFLTSVGAKLVTRTTNYWRLALANTTHFQPLATREWREFHKESIALALAASRSQGAALLEGFENVTLRLSYRSTWRPATGSFASTSDLRSRSMTRSSGCMRHSASPRC